MKGLPHECALYIGLSGQFYHRAAFALHTFNVWPERGRRSSQTKPRMPFKEIDVQEIRNIPGVMAASGELARSATIATETGDVAGRIYGVDTDFLAVEDASLVLGENITYSEIENSEPVVLISQSKLGRKRS